MSGATELAVGPARQERQLAPVVITGDQIDLIKATIAKDATDAELSLFFYDCRRRGVHPLDKLIHFTKRKGKYTPVTSIDYFRARAAETKEHMGTEDAVFSGKFKAEDFAATVTVYRMVHGEKCRFTATARWIEYCPEAGNDFMWHKMPHSQLGKCAEALSLRKGFPQQLAGLYTFDEMDQATNGEDEKPSGDQRQPEMQPPQRTSAEPAAPAANQPLPSGTVLVTKTDPRNGETNGRKWTLYIVTFSDGRSGGTLNPDIAAYAEKVRLAKTPVIPVLEPGKKAGSFQLIQFGELTPAAGEAGTLPVEDIG